MENVFLWQPPMTCSIIQDPVCFWQGITACAVPASIGILNLEWSFFQAQENLFMIKITAASQNMILWMISCTCTQAVPSFPPA